MPHTVDGSDGSSRDEGAACEHGGPLVCRACVDEAVARAVKAVLGALLEEVRKR